MPTIQLLDKFITSSRQFFADTEKLNRYFIGIGVIAVCMALLFLRRPDTLLNAQFWAEDGRVWFANSYNYGALRSVFLPQDGYFQTLSRLTAGVAWLFPLVKAPLVFNLIALLVQILPVGLLLTNRWQNLLPSYRLRVALALGFVLLPNVAEMHANVTNAQWYLAVSAFLVLIAPVAKNKFWQIFDALVLVLAGLSGPFAILLTPILFLLWYYRRDTQYRNRMMLVMLTAVIQIWGILFLSEGSRVSHLPELNIRLIGAILGRQVFWGALVGVNGYSWVLQHVSWYFWLIASTTIACVGLVLRIFLKAPLELRLLMLFGLLVFIASVFFPTGDFTRYSALKLLSRSMDGARYWLMPMLAFLMTLVWGAIYDSRKVIRVICGLLLSTMVFGIVLDFRHKPYHDYEFASYINKLGQIPSRTELRIPINPPDWDLILIKR